MFIRLYLYNCIYPSSLTIPFFNQKVFSSSEMQTEVGFNDRHILVVYNERVISGKLKRPLSNKNRRLAFLRHIIPLRTSISCPLSCPAWPPVSFGVKRGLGNSDDETEISDDKGSLLVRIKGHFGGISVRLLAGERPEFLKLL